MARFLSIALAALVAAPLSAHAQGKTQKQIVISPSALAVMSAQKSKSKSKTPLMSRVGITSRQSVAPPPTAVKSAVMQPTSVRAVKNQRTK